VQISCPMWSKFFVALCMYLIEEANKEEELVDVALGWGWSTYMSCFSTLCDVLVYLCVIC
jgi:hypothetical protein